MTDTPDEQASAAPRPRPAPRPSPGPRVAGRRRGREETGASSGSPVQGSADPGAVGRGDGRGDERSGARSWHRLLALVLALLCVASAAGLGLLVRERLHPPYVDASVFAASRSSIEALYAFDYKDAKGSVQRKLDVLTGDLRDQYEKDLSQGGIIDTYEQVSATTSYDVLDVALQEINDAQDTATVVVFGQYVAKSVNSGKQPAPQGSECQVTPDGAQACTQTLRVRLIDVDGTWKVSELTLLSTS